MLLNKSLKKLVERFDLFQYFGSSKALKAKKNVAIFLSKKIMQNFYLSSNYKQMKIFRKLKFVGFL